MQIRLRFLVFVVPAMLAVVSLDGPSTYHDPKTWKWVANQLILLNIAAPVFGVMLAYLWSKRFMAMGYRPIVAIFSAVLYALIFCAFYIAFVWGLTAIADAIQPSGPLVW